MSQYADGGVVGSKPYIATGAYIARQSNYCTHCKYDPKLATGDRACPFTTLYWAFLDRHATAFRDHPRMALQVRNLDRKSEEELQAIRVQAAAVHDKLDAKQL
jgi:deoxyribodipyrimidine photolyase-related protein